MNRGEAKYEFMKWLNGRMGESHDFFRIAIEAYERGVRESIVEPLDAALWGALDKAGVLDIQAREVGRAALPTRFSVADWHPADYSVNMNTAPIWQLDVRWVMNGAPTLKTFAQQLYVRKGESNG